MRLLWGVSAIIGLGIAAPVFAPALMAFPYRQQLGQHQVYSVTPISSDMADIVAKADNKVAASPSGLFRASDQSIFLTGGGWRWRWLAGTSQDAFAITRAVNDAVIINHASISDDAVYRSASVGGERSLSGVIAHEMTHGSIRSHFGIAADWLYPVKLREGYCDFVAGEGSLSDEDARFLIQRGVKHPALPYWIGRKRIEVELARNGSDIDRLFADWDDQYSE